MISDAERRIYEGMALPFAMCQLADDRIHALLVSDGMCAAFRYTRAQMLDALRGGMPGHTHPDDRDWVHRSNDDFLHRRSEKLNVVFRNRARPDEDYRLTQCVGFWQTLLDGSDMAVLAYFDLEEAQTGIARLFTAFGKTQNELIYSDPVTGLPNLNFLRQFADERINDFWVHDKQPLMIYFDVKGMHAYNVSYGYTNGDRLMRLVADTLRAEFPEGTVARGADDHFIVITAWTDEADITGRVERVNDTVKQRAYATVSGVRAGITKIEPKHRSVNAFDCARQALREIGDDLNTVWRFYSAEKDSQYWKRRYLLENFDRALEEGWVRVYYQPIVRTHTRKMSVLESLARWVDPQRGVIPPAEFIPLLARYHLLYRLDLYMVEQICKEYAVREKAGLPLLPVSVNFSAQDFDHVNVPEALCEILARYGLGHDRIIVEITEQDLAKGTEHFKAQLGALRERGFTLWLDDFGSGYSSLNVFSQFDIDRIKFDAALLQHLDDMGGANRRILRAINKVCRELGVHTLCEGVETEAQFQFLQEIDCEMAQGFYFYRPNPIEGALDKIHTHGKTRNFEDSRERESSEIQWLLKEGET